MNIKELSKNLQVEDDHIILNGPHVKEMYGKYVYIKQINWFYKWEKFIYYLGLFLKYYYVICENSRLPDKLSDIENFRNNVRITIGANKSAFRLLAKMCKNVEIKENNKKIRWKLHWMKKNFSIDDWVDIFCTVYLYNLKGVKKNLYEGLLLLSRAQLN